MRDQALHDAVLAAPDDDAPRLVYADWLMERGDPRGEFIAVQVQRANHHTPELEAREQALWSTHYAEWTKPFHHMYLRFRRGFAEQLHVGRNHLHHLDEALADACLRDVQLRGFDRITDILPYLERMRLRELELYYGTVDPATAHEFLRAPALRALQSFAVTSSTFDPDALATIVEADTLANVRALALRLLRLEDRVLVLERWKYGARSLDLSHNGIRSGVIDLVLAAAFPRVEALDLSRNRLRTRDVEAIYALDLPLTSLNLAGNSLDPAAAHFIARSPQSARLRSLGLADAGIGEDGMKALADSPYLPQGMWLALDGDLLGLHPRGSRWEGEPPAMLTDRFRVEIDGEPAY